jgi:hypothetical protein
MRAAPDGLSYAEGLLEQRCLGEAFAAFQLAEAAGYDADRCSAGRWIAAMLAGDFETAWQESDAIRKRGLPDPNRFWSGESLDGKRVIVRCLHGFGDAVQFLRYGRQLKSLASYVIVECAPAMLELVRCLAGIDEVITWGRDAPPTPPGWEVQLELMELPYVFRSTLASLPGLDGYLKLPDSVTKEARSAVGRPAYPRVGVVWASGEWNPARSTSIEALHPILSRRDFQFWNLQGGPARTEWPDIGEYSNLRDHRMLNDAGVLALAAIISQLDLVIGVDTLAVHLAGALNIPCLLMLQNAADWRWMTGRNDSPWYPSLRLFRQPRPGDWETVVRQVGGVLDQWIQAAARGVA